MTSDFIIAKGDYIFKEDIKVGDSIIVHEISEDNQGNVIQQGVDAIINTSYVEPKSRINVPPTYENFETFSDESEMLFARKSNAYILLNDFIIIDDNGVTLNATNWNNGNELRDQLQNNENLVGRKVYAQVIFHTSVDHDLDVLEGNPLEGTVIGTALSVLLEQFAIESIIIKISNIETTFGSIETFDSIYDSDNNDEPVSNTYQKGFYDFLVGYVSDSFDMGNGHQVDIWLELDIWSTIASRMAINGNLGNALFILDKLRGTDTKLNDTVIREKGILFNIEVTSRSHAGNSDVADTNLSLPVWVDGEITAEKILGMGTVGNLHHKETIVAFFDTMFNKGIELTFPIRQGEQGSGEQQDPPPTEIKVQFPKLELSDWKVGISFDKVGNDIALDTEEIGQAFLYLAGDTLTLENWDSTDPDIYEIDKTLYMGTTPLLNNYVTVNDGSGSSTLILWENLVVGQDTIYQINNDPVEYPVDEYNQEIPNKFEGYSIGLSKNLLELNFGEIVDILKSQNKKLKYYVVRKDTKLNKSGIKNRLMESVEIALIDNIVELGGLTNRENPVIQKLLVIDLQADNKTWTEVGHIRFIQEDPRPMQNKYTDRLKKPSYFVFIGDKIQYNSLEIEACVDYCHSIGKRLLIQM